MSDTWKSKEVLSVPETARLLGISRSLAFTMVKRGELPALRLGEKRIVVPTVALKRMLDKAAGE